MLITIVKVTINFKMKCTYQLNYDENLKIYEIKKGK